MYHLLICECGREITVTRKQAGQELTCTCGQRITVPTLRGFSTLAVVESPVVENQSNNSRGEKGTTAWSGWRGPAIAIASTIFLISGLATTRFLYHRYLLDTSYTAQSGIAAGNALFDESHPEELSLAWNDYQKLRLGPKDRPMFYRIAEFARDREFSAAVSGSICLLSGLLAAGIWLSTRRRR